MKQKSSLTKFAAALLMIALMSFLCGLLGRAAGGGGGTEALVVAVVLSATLIPATMTNTVTVPCPDRAALLARLYPAIRGRGWRPRTETPEYAVYKPASFVAALMDDLVVDFTVPASATLTGPVRS